MLNWWNTKLITTPLERISKRTTSPKFHSTIQVRMWDPWGNSMGRVTLKMRMEGRVDMLCGRKILCGGFSHLGFNLRLINKIVVSGR